MKSTKLSQRTVSAIAVIDLANELIDRECIKENVREILGEDFLNCYHAWLNNETIHEKRLPEQLLIRLWREARNSTKGESIDSKSTNLDSIGLKIGKKVNHSAKGLLANWVLQCDTLEESFDTFHQNIHLLNPSEKWTKVEEGEYVKLVFHFEQDYPDIAVDRSLATIVSWSTALSGHSIQPIKAKFQRQSPTNIEDFHGVFGANLAFNQEENCLIFSKKTFKQANKSNNPYLKALLKDKASELNLVLNKEQSVKAAVEKLLYLDLAKFCQIDHTIKALHQSRSTLYRKLKAEETSFTDLVKAARMTRSKWMEEKKLPISEIADELGFQDVSSFYRFRKTF